MADQVKRLIGFDKDTYQIVKDYADKYTAGNVSAAVRQLVAKGKQLIEEKG